MTVNEMVVWGISDSMDMRLSKLLEIVKDWHAVVHEAEESDTT